MQTTTQTSTPDGVRLERMVTDHESILIYDSQDELLGRVYWNKYSGRWYAARKHLGSSDYNYHAVLTKEQAVNRIITHQAIYRLTGEYP